MRSFSSKFSILAISLAFAFSSLSAPLFAQDMNLYPAKSVKDPKNIFSNLEIPTAGYKFDIEPQKDINKETDLSTKPKSPKEEIIAKFGDPLEPHPVAATEEAPKPFKALIEAIKVGDRELAFQYAAQYVRYVEDLKSLNQEAVAYQGKAMQKIGIIPEDSWAKDKRYSEYDDLMSVSIDKYMPKEASRQFSAEVTSLIEQAKQADDLEKVSKVQAPRLALDEKSERTRAQIEHADFAPSAEGGKVEVYFFFNPSETKSYEHSSFVERLYQETTIDPQVTMMGFLSALLDHIELNNYKVSTGITFPVLNGLRLAKELDLEGKSALAFVLPDTQEYYVIKDITSYYYVSEVLKIIKGDLE